MSKYKSKSKRGKISLDEFRAWLSGVEEMQSEDWSPDKGQWTTIRNKLDTIDVTEVVAVEPAAPIVHQPVYQPQHQPQPQSAFQPQQEGSGLPAAAPAQSLQPQGASPGSLKTPDIDSSEGYKSGFA